MACSRSRRPLPRAATSSRTRAASCSESGLFSGSSGTKDSTAMSVSLSRNTSLTKWCASKQRRGSASPHRPCGVWASQLIASGRPRRHAPSGSTMWVWMSKMNWRPASVWAAATGSTAASRGRSNEPPRWPRHAKASFSVRSVVAAPHMLARNSRRPWPVRRACSVMRAAASLFARSTAPPTGSGANSPLDVESSLIGSVGSCRMALPRCPPVYSTRPECRRGATARLASPLDAAGAGPESASRGSGLRGEGP